MRRSWPIFHPEGASQRGMGGGVGEMTRRRAFPEVGLVYVKGAGAVGARARAEGNGYLTDGDSIVSASEGESGKQVWFLETF